MIVFAIYFLISASKEVSAYSTFAEARSNGKLVKVAGQLSKDKEMVYNPVNDPNHFSFFIKDTNGDEHKVVLAAAKPKDFEMSEQIVVTGKIKGDEFHASEILMKCPSKYKDEEVYIKSQKEI